MRRIAALLRRRRRLSALVLGLLGAWLMFAAGWQRWRAEVGEPTAALSERWYAGHRILDRNGTILRELPADAGHNRRGRPTALDEIGERLILATLAAEDADFYAHDGVDEKALLRAVQQNLRHGRIVSGGSTITQQLVKLLDTRGVPEPRDVDVKLREMARAQNLERELSKDEILGAYMDRLPYGHGLVGPEAAAHGYFDVASRDLSWGQATFLAVLPRAPSYLDPYLHRDRVELRRRALVEQLYELELIDEPERRRALKETVRPRPLQHPFDAPHFVQMLLAEERIDRAADVTVTTLDGALQGDVEGLVRTHMAKMAELAAHDAAVIVVDNGTGDVLAWVGSTDFHDPEISGQVDMVRSPRQPGSALKPFVYARAFEQGHTGAEMVADVPTEFSEDGGRVYAPKNFHGGHVGPISAREALAASLNVPVVRLAADLPPGDLLETLHALGMTSLTEDAAHYGLALALGSGEVSLRELASAYVTLARGGQAIDLRVLADDPLAEPRTIFEPAIAATVTEALSDPLARVRLLEGRSPFDIGFDVAVKTGTSSGYRDAWTVGFTHERTVAVWVGNADGSPMLEVTGAGGAGGLFADVMRRAMRDVNSRGPLFDPDLLVAVPVCPLSGQPPSEHCPHAVQRRFVPEHVPGEPCTVHRRVSRTGRGPLQRRAGVASFTCDPAGSQESEVVAVLPQAFESWLLDQPPGAPGKDPDGHAWVSERDVAGCGAHDHAQPLLRIVEPSDGAVFLLAHDGTHRDRVELAASFEGPRQREPQTIEFVVDGKVLARSPYPYRALVELGPGHHEVYARPADADAAVAWRAHRFNVQ